MFSKINVSSIVVDHFLTLKNYKTGKIHMPDLFLFFAIPLFLSIALVYFKVQIGKDFANIILTCFSIFAGLLFNLLLLVFDIADKPSASQQDIRDVLRELYINISFCILISICTIIFSLGFFVGINQSLYLNIFSFLIYFPLLVFLLTLFMVLKRIYKLLSKKFENRF